MIDLIIGFIGAFLILIAFILNETKKWDDGDLKYDLSNASGSLLLVIYGFLTKTWPFLILNTIWFAVALRDTIIDLKKRGK